MSKVEVEEEISTQVNVLRYICFATPTGQNAKRACQQCVAKIRK